MWNEYIALSSVLCSTMARVDSGSFYQNRNIIFDIPVLFDPEPEFKILVPEMGFRRIPAEI